MPPWATGRSSPSGWAAHEVVGRRDAQCLPHLFVGEHLSRCSPVAQVLGDGPGEQVAALGDQADGRPQLFEIELADIDAVDADRAGRDVVEPADHRQQGGFAGTGGTHDRGGGAAPSAKRNLLQHGAIGAGIAERRVIEVDLAGEGLHAAPGPPGW